jgi:hypothetical protein
MFVAMKENEQRYLVSGFAVTLVRAEQGVRWECGCGRDACAHVLQVAAWMTLQSWQDLPSDRPH